MRQIVCDVCGNTAKMLMTPDPDCRFTYSVQILSKHDDSWLEHTLVIQKKQSTTNHKETVTLCPSCTEKYDSVLHEARKVFTETMSSWWCKNLKKGDNVDVYECDC